MTAQPISRRRFLGASSGGLAASSLLEAQADAGLPNIVFLMTDNHRWDLLGCAGNDIIRTPNIDALAARGARFTNSFCTTSICAATRASILTGEFRREHRYTFTMPPMSIQRMDRSYPALLKRAGYRTGFVGKLGVEVDPRTPERMFDFYRRRIASSTRNPYYREAADGTIKHLTEINGDDAVEFIRTNPTDQPFCLSVSFSAPHPEDDNIDQYVFDRRYQDLYQNDVIPPPPIPDNEHFRRLPGFIQVSMSRQRWFRRFDTPEKYQRMMKGMYRLITGVDEQVGRIVDELSSRGFGDNTVVIFTGDNGIMIGEHGLTGNLADVRGLHPQAADHRRPAAARFAARRHGRRDGAQLRQPRHHARPRRPSMCPRQMRGRSLAPLLRGESVDWRKDFFYEQSLRARDDPEERGRSYGETSSTCAISSATPYTSSSSTWRRIRTRSPTWRADPSSGNVLKSLRARCDELRDSVGGPYVRGM